MVLLVHSSYCVYCKNVLMNSMEGAWKHILAKKTMLSPWEKQSQAKAADWLLCFPVPDIQLEKLYETHLVSKWELSSLHCSAELLVCAFWCSVAPPQHTEGTEPSELVHSAYAKITHVREVHSRERATLRTCLPAAACNWPWHRLSLNSAKLSMFMAV